MFHGLADGCGTMRFARTVLYYYCCERYDASLPSDGILVDEHDIPQEEWDNPYIQIMNGERSLPNFEDVAVKLKNDGGAAALSLFNDTRITFSKRKHYQIRVSEKLPHKRRYTRCFVFAADEPCYRQAQSRK